MNEPGSDLRTLARLYDVMTEYHDVTGEVQRASTDSLLAVLRALGAPVHSVNDVPEAIRCRRLEQARRMVDPVAVVRGDDVLRLKLIVPRQLVEEPIAAELHLESGISIRPEARRTTGDSLGEVEGIEYVEVWLEIPGPMAHGRHRITIALGEERREVHLIAAPRKAWWPRAGGWGVFEPTYALQSSATWGAGNLSELEGLVRFTAAHGGNLAGTLPLSAAFLDEPFDPSPYAPVSRRFWNELFLDVAALPEFSTVADRFASEELQRRLQQCRDASWVDYREQAALQRELLQPMAEVALGIEPAAMGLERFVRQQPSAEDYARFRAVMERRRCSWRDWPEPARTGDLRGESFDAGAYRHHLYVQWRFHEQLQALRGEAGEKGVGLYLDLPLGVHPDGYDAWREQQSFLPGMAAGAPPDSFFTSGQNWGFAPLHPEHIREDGYRYFADCLQVQLEAADVLRLDHVMWMHRLFVIPDGMSATEGLYIRYRWQELYPLLTLQSRRHRSAVLGEDLGTVPPEVRQTMAEHDILRMYVTQYEVDGDNPHTIHDVPRNAVAFVNTHDMPTFAAWAEGDDLQIQQDLGWIDAEDMREQRQERTALLQAIASFLAQAGYCDDPQSMLSVVTGVLAHLAESPAPLLIVNLEDLWLERQPHNVPGTGFERPNWRRKAAHTLEELADRPEVVRMLDEIAKRRKRAHDEA